MTNAILVIKHGSFGDIIQINGCLRDIRENYIDNEIYILTTPAFRSYFERCPYIDKVIVDERKSRWNIFYLLKIKNVIINLKFQKIFDLQNSRRTEFYRKYLSNSIEWISSRTILNPNERKEEFDKKSILERFNIQLSRANVNVQFTHKPQVTWMIDQEFAIPSSIKKNYITLFPFCSIKHRQKIWPHYEDLITKLKIKYPDADIVIVPGPGEYEKARNYNVKILMNNGEHTNFFQLSKILAGSKYVISNDTGPAHLAAHLGCKGLTIFGSHTSPEKVSIQTDNFHSISSKNLYELTPAIVIEKIDSHL